MSERKSLRKYEYSLLELCEELHMNCTGASDSIIYHGAAGFKELYLTLKKRVEEWATSPDFCAAYDFAVKSLCEITLHEVETKFPEVME